MSGGPAELTLGRMSPNTTPSMAASAHGCVILDHELPDRPPLGQAEGYDAALRVLASLQEQFYAQLDSNGEGGHDPELALIIAPVDAAGIGPACYWHIVNGIRPAGR